jgi:prepilin-type N-terminal cleavage/methylation domain-containing protein
MAIINLPNGGAGGGCGRRGLTLVEVTISMLVMAVMLVAALSMLGSAAKARLVLANRQLGPVLARQLMMEIVQNHYDHMTQPSNFGPEPGENTGTRSAFDDVDDYDTWTECPPRDKTGNILPNCAGWTRSVQVCYADLVNPMGQPAGSDLGLKRVIVTVTAPGGKKTVLVALRTRYSDQPSAVIVQRLTWANIGLQIGDDPGTRRTTATTVLNAVPQQP